MPRTGTRHERPKSFGQAGGVIAGLNRVRNSSVCRCRFARTACNSALYGRCSRPNNARSRRARTEHASKNLSFACGPQRNSDLWSRQGISSVDYRCPSHVSHTNPFAFAVHDAVCAPVDCFPFFTPGAWAANNANQSNADRTIAGLDLLSYAASRRKYLRTVHRAFTGGPHYSDAGYRTGRSASPAVHAALRPRQRRCAVRGFSQGTPTAHPGRSVLPRAAARLHSVGAKGRIPNWRSAFSSIFGHRYGCRVGFNFRRYVAVAASSDFHTAQIIALRDGGWMAFADRFIDEKF